MIRDLPHVAILAGGLAKRLRPLTDTIPKALVKVNGRPFIFHQLEQLKEQKVSRVVCCVGFKGEMIEKVVGDGSRFGLQISYSYDGERFLGTGGSLKKARKMLGEQFFVLYGDSYLQVSYVDVKRKFNEEGKKGLLTIYENKGSWDASNLHYRNNHIIAYSKVNRIPEMTYIDYGLSLLKSDVFEEVPEGEYFDLSTIYEHLVQESELAAFEVTERFYEIGSPEGLLEFENFVRNT